MTRWNIVVSDDTDRTVRNHLARTGGGKAACRVSWPVRSVMRSWGRPSNQSGNETGTSRPKKRKPSPTTREPRFVRIVLDINVLVSAEYREKDRPGTCWPLPDVATSCSSPPYITFQSLRPERRLGGYN